MIIFDQAKRQKTSTWRFLRCQHNSLMKTRTVTVSGDSVSDLKKTIDIIK